MGFGSCNRQNHHKMVDPLARPPAALYNINVVALNKCDMFWVVSMLTYIYMFWGYAAIACHIVIGISYLCIQCFECTSQSLYIIISLTHIRFKRCNHIANTFQFNKRPVMPHTHTLTTTGKINDDVPTWWLCKIMVTLMLYDRNGVGVTQTHTTHTHTQFIVGSALYLTWTWSVISRKW